MSPRLRFCLETALYGIVTAAIVIAIVVAYAALTGCSALERVDMSGAFARGIVEQTVKELKVVLGVTVLEMQNELRELLWETFYKITGAGATGTAMIVGHRYTKSYKNVQQKAIRAV